MARTLTTLLPLLVPCAGFVLALAVFSLRTWIHGLPADDEVSRRPASKVLGRYLRHFLMWFLRPVEGALVRLRVPPNAITGTSVGVSLAAAGLLATNHFGAGGWLYLVAGILDILDGRVARQTGRVTTGGAFFDSVADRYAELAVFAGLCWYYRGGPVLLAALGAMAGSLLVSYVRARGEACGVDVKIGTMQRPERLFYLGVLVACSPMWDALVPGADAALHAPAVAGLVMLAVSTNVTAMRRLRHTLAILDAREQPAVVAPTPLRPAGVVEARGRRLLERWRTGVGARTA